MSSPASLEAVFTMDDTALPNAPDPKQLAGPFTTDTAADASLLDRDVLPQAQKRPFGDLDTFDSSGPKRTRLSQSRKTAHPQPTPKPPNADFAFLKNSANPGRSRSQDSVHDFVSEWLESVGSPRRHRRSRSEERRLHESDTTPGSYHNPEKLSKSLPDMSNRRDSDGFAIPPVPSSSGRRSRQGSAMSGSSQYRESSPSSNGGVRNRMYREQNLTKNGLEFQGPGYRMPDEVARNLETIRATRDSPGPSEMEMKEIREELHYLDQGSNEEQVVEMIKDRILPRRTDTDYGPGTGLMNITGALMSPAYVPNNPQTQFRVSQPKPDILYGYSGKSNTPFTQQELLAEESVYGLSPQANQDGLRFPFLCLEVKSAGGTSGDLWVAANQCAGASAACLNAIEVLQTALPQTGGKVTRLDRMTYAVALDNNTAKLYISWKEDSHYYLKMVESFSLFRPDDFRALRRQVRNILDWGKDKRLKQIREALDTVIKESAKAATELAKARPTPPSDSDSNSSKRPKK